MNQRTGSKGTLNSQHAQWRSNASVGSKPRESVTRRPPPSPPPRLERPEDRYGIPNAVPAGVRGGEAIARRSDKMMQLRRRREKIGPAASLGSRAVRLPPLPPHADSVDVLHTIIDTCTTRMETLPRRGPRGLGRSSCVRPGNHLALAARSAPRAPPSGACLALEHAIEARAARPLASSLPHAVRCALRPATAGCTTVMPLTRTCTLPSSQSAVDALCIR